jgi:histidyl-tRNA synthetase
MPKDKDRKPRRPRAETPRGFRDWFGAEVRARDAMLARITEVYRRYGFDPLETPAIETVDALGKFLPDVDRPEGGVFAWGDASEGWLALRYDLTAPLARVYAQHRQNLPTPYRRYQAGPVWRNEKPGPGRFRQFTQCDADTVGAASPAADAEMAAMLADALEAAGVARGDYLVRINNRKVLNGVLDTVYDPNIKLGRQWNTRSDTIEAAFREVDTQSLLSLSQRSDVLRSIDKYDKIGVEGVRQLLTNGRRDESGAMIEGLGLTDWAADAVVGFLTARASSDEETIRNLREAVKDAAVGQDGIDELETIAEFLDRQGYGPDRVRIDPTVVRGLAYYTGPVVEAELTFEIADEKGRPRRFGSVAGGGRYDDLVRRFTGQAVPATGISIGVDRLLAALAARGAGAQAELGPVVVTVMDRAAMADCQAMAAELRGAGVRAEVFLGGGNLARQLRYADQRASPVAVIAGPDERARGVVQLKDLALGARLAAEIEDRAAWRAQPAQTEAPRSGLVEAVRALLARASG